MAGWEGLEQRVGPNVREEGGRGVKVVKKGGGGGKERRGRRSGVL